MLRKLAHCAAFLTGLAILTGGAQAQPTQSTLEIVRARGVLNCAVATNVVGFAAPDTQGVYRGIDAESCRAIAAAVLGDATKVRFIPTTVQNRFTVLQSGEADVMIRNTTWSLAREGNLGLMFASINFYDGQGFLVRTSTGAKTASDLNGATICAQSGSTTELNVADYFRQHNMTFTPVVMADVEELNRAFLSGRCDVYTNDASSLATLRLRQGEQANQYVLLPDLISKEPLGAAVRKGDDRWFDIVRWAFFAQLTAEELGITSQNIATFADSANPEIRRFLGAEGEMGKALGLDARWAFNIVSQVGNYAEMWDRTWGALGVPRGVNNLWNRGGLMYAPPIR